MVFHDRGVESLEAIHGHNGRTRIVWLDGGDRCDAVTVLTGSFEVVRCNGTIAHPHQHDGTNSAGTTLLWYEDAVHYERDRRNRP